VGTVGPILSTFTNVAEGGVGAAISYYLSIMD
jgi:hypothetical protein